MLSLLVQIVFWICMGGMIHTYVIYPFSLRVFRRRYAQPPVMPEGAWPRVALLIPAYNEENVIAAKIENSLALDYEPEKLEILIGSDGSTDRTNEIVRSCTDARVRLIELPGRSGKTGVINRLVQESMAEILAISDANVTLDRLAFRHLIRHFADPSVGTANGGKYILIPKGAEAVRGEAIYGTYENWLRTRESEVGGMSGALGSLMAFRRGLFRPFPRGSTNDDTVPAIWAVLAGRRQAHEPKAKAYEESGGSVAAEFRRRIRIGAGNFQTLFRYRQILQPRYGIAAYTFFSHKVLRWVFPLLMLGALLSSAILCSHRFYHEMFLAQVVGYGGCALGFVFDRLRWHVPVLSGLYHFVALNLALLIGFVVYCRGIGFSGWERTAREVAK